LRAERALLGALARAVEGAREPGEDPGAQAVVDPVARLLERRDEVPLERTDLPHARAETERGVCQERADAEAAGEGGGAKKRGPRGREVGRDWPGVAGRQRHGAAAGLHSPVHLEEAERTRVALRGLLVGETTCRETGVPHQVLDRSLGVAERGGGGERGR